MYTLILKFNILGSKSNCFVQNFTKFSTFIPVFNFHLGKQFDHIHKTSCPKDAKCVEKQ